MTSDDDIEERFQIALGHLREKRPIDALAVFDQLLALRPGHKALLGMRGTTLLSLDRNEEAAEIFQGLVARSPRSEKASLGLFYALWALDKQVEALEEMKRFLSIAESDEYQTLRKNLRLVPKE